MNKLYLIENPKSYSIFTLNCGYGCWYERVNRTNSFHIYVKTKFTNLLKPLIFSRFDEIVIDLMFSAVLKTY